MATEMVRYVAQDGSHIELTPADLVRDIVGCNEGEVSDREVLRTLMTLQARGLNPYAGDCYLTPAKGRIQLTTSKDYYMRVAESQPTFDGFEAGVTVITKDGELVRREGSLVGGKTERLVGGWARVHDKARTVPTFAEVSLAEYDQQRALWLTKPATMIRKVALVQALRETYTAQFGGLYEAGEVPTDEVDEEEEASYEGDQ